MAKRKKPNTPPDNNPDFYHEKEQMMNAVQRALNTGNFETQEEANAFLQQFVGMKMADITKALGGGGPPSREDQADDMFISAMESRSRFEMRRKLKAVLKFDPGHVRALAALAFMETKPEAVEKGLRQAIETGEKKLGPLLEEESGELWGWWEARPYMEVRAELARFLVTEDRLDEAIEEHFELLRLNENDNQGLRDPLLGLLLETRRFDEARALVKRYDNDFSAVWLYGKALLRFIECAEKAGWDTSAHDAAWLQSQMHTMAAGGVPELPKALRPADKALVKALENNPWGAIYLIKAQDYIDMPMPGSYGPGSEEEARILLEYQVNAWVSFPSALLWLMVVGMPWLMQNGYEDEMAT